MLRATVAIAKTRRLVNSILLEQSLPKENDKKATMLKCGARLFREQGFAATGVSEITKASGVPKGSFYHYFESKEAFATEIIDCYARDFSAFLDTQLLQGSGSPLERFRATIDDISDNQFTKYGGCGCLAGNLCQEIAAQSPQLQDALSRAFGELQGKFAACLHMAKGAGELDEQLDVDEMAAFIFNAWQGVLLRSKAEQDLTAFDNFRRIVFAVLLS